MTVQANAQGISGSGTIGLSATTGTLSLTVPATVAAGTYSLSAAASDGTVSHTANFNLQVTTASPANDFTVTVTTAMSIQANTSGNGTVTITRTGGESAAITLIVQSNSQGISGSGSVASDATTGSLSIAVPSAVGAGTYALVASATDGSLTHTACFNLQVTAAGTADPWAPVTAAIQSVQSQFPGALGSPAGLTVEVMTTDGVVYSQAFGAFTNQTDAAVASASKWVSASAILRLVDAGVLSLDSQTKSFLTDVNGAPWAGNRGEIKLRHLLSFTSGIPGSDANDGSSTITLDQAVKNIYSDNQATAQSPGSYFDYGDTHLRIAARMAEVATGKTWRQVFQDEIQTPLGWSALSTFGNGTNPDPAGGLACTGLEYTRFVMLQLRHGLDGTTRVLSDSIINQQRTDAYGPSTTISYSPYVALRNETFHYGFGNWLETANGLASSTTNPVIRWSSTGKFGWAPWVTADGAYAAVIMTRQVDLWSSEVPSENLKIQLDPLIRAALASHPAVIRTVP